jgi:NAD(P)-dependent dehydrogenase (short-subunit alcohol dehydrogenase family)
MVARRSMHSHLKNIQEDPVDEAILVTGASGGVGSVLVEKLLKRGAKVAGVSRSGQQTVQGFPEFLSVAADLASADGAGTAVRTVVERFTKIDGLVHTVGGFAFGALHELPEPEWRRMVDENLHAAYYLLRAALPPMRERRHGRIVILGSLAATQPHAGFSAYVATKAALHSLVQSVALENRGLDITINAILPGTIDTAMNRQAMPDADRSRWLSPQKLALLCAQLLGDPEGTMSGALLPLER